MNRRTLARSPIPIRNSSCNDTEWRAHVPSSVKVQCEYLNGDLCSAIVDGEAKATRENSCRNSTKNLCCYLCDDRKSCTISCAYLDNPKELAENKTVEFSGRYIGGDGAHSKRLDVTLSLSQEALVIEELDLRIPYSSIKEVDNINVEDLDALRDLVISAFGSMWTEPQEECLCIKYEDEGGSHVLVFRMNEPEEAQNEIYKRVLDSARENHVGKPVHFVVCAYCGARYDANENFKCPNCGGINAQ